MVEVVAFTAGLVPTDPASRFVLKIAPVPDPGNPGQFLSGRKNLIFGPRFNGRTYTVKSKADLSAAIWSPRSSFTSIDNVPLQERTVTDQSATGAKKFYRVEITKP